MTTILIICVLIYVVSWLFLNAHYDVHDVPSNCVWAWVFMFTPILNTVCALMIVLYAKSLSFRQFMWIVFNGLTLLVNEVIQGYYRTISIDGIHNSYEWDFDNVARLWTIQDTKDGDVIFYDDGWTCIFKNIHGIWYSSYCFITADEEFHAGYEQHAVDAKLNGNTHPATKEQRNLLFQKMHEAGYEWDAEKKELKKTEQKPVWSEGDIAAIDCAVEVLSKDLPSLAASIERLKSLRPHSQWKPSDEQMEALDIAIRCGIQLGTWEETALKSLREQLIHLKKT